jgi:hypothetical protein
MAQQVTTNQQTQTGNLVVVQFNGVNVGLIRSVSLNDSYGLEGVYQIGDIEPVENVPTRASYGLTVSNMQLITQNMRSAGLIPENGVAVLQGIVFNFVVYSKASGKKLRTYFGCSYDSGHVDVTANAMISQSSQWKALTVSGTGL